MFAAGIVVFREVIAAALIISLVMADTRVRSRRRYELTKVDTGEAVARASTAWGYL